MQAIDHYIFAQSSTFTPVWISATWGAVSRIQEGHGGTLAPARECSTLDLRGQAKTMDDSFFRLGSIVFAIVLVYLLMASLPVVG